MIIVLTIKSTIFQPQFSSKLKTNCDDFIWGRCFKNNFTISIISIKRVSVIGNCIYICKYFHKQNDINTFHTSANEVLHIKFNTIQLTLDKDQTIQKAIITSTFLYHAFLYGYEKLNSRNFSFSDKKIENFVFSIKILVFF